MSCNGRPSVGHAAVVSFISLLDGGFEGVGSLTGNGCEWHGLEQFDPPVVADLRERTTGMNLLTVEP